MEIAKQSIGTIQGVIERLVFYAKDSGFAIASLRPNHPAGAITLSGNLPQIAEGDEITVEGSWVKHPKYGMQFHVVSYMKVLPVEADAIEAYLASGMIKGLGPTTAAKIVRVFGAETLNILTKSPERLMEIPGIGEKKTETIAKAWKEQIAVTELMVFLSGCGITPAYATKIYRQYGLDAIRVIQNNPYQLSYDVTGIGFLVADRIARKNGIDKLSPLRIEAGTLFTLEEGRKEGHCYYPEWILRKRAAKLLEVNEELIGNAVTSLVLARRVIVEQADGQKHIYPPVLYKHETESARLLVQKAISPSPYCRVMSNAGSMISMSERKFNVTLSKEQREAVYRACENTVSIITGGPGVGKTLTTKVIVDVFKQKGATVFLAAPTGKAAKRLGSCGQDAKTIHRLLEYSPAINGFARNEKNPLECDILIVDEMSMTDISLFYFLIRALPSGSHIVIIGDADQLPSVGPGSLMRQLVDSGALPLTVLERIFRQEEGSGIVRLAHSINQGIIPGLAYFKNDDCVFIEAEDPVQAANRAVKIAGYMEDHGIDVQVLSPMHKGDAGTIRLNEMMQEELNPIPFGENNTYQVVRGFRKFRINDRVIQTKNDYEKMVFNGDSGVIVNIDHEEQTIDVVFDGRGLVIYDYLDMEQLLLSRCLSIHKSQGSEYDVVIVMCLQSHYIMLARNLLYTAITRAKKTVIIIGTQSAMATAINNNKQKARYSCLKERIQHALFSYSQDNHQTDTLAC